MAEPAVATARARRPARRSRRASRPARRRRARAARDRPLAAHDARWRRGAPAERADGAVAAGLAARPADGLARMAQSRVGEGQADAPSPWMSLALATIDVPVEQALFSQAFGWAENQVQAALKAVPLGQTAGQRVPTRLRVRDPRRGAPRPSPRRPRGGSCSRRCCPSSRRATKPSTPDCSDHEHDLAPSTTDCLRFRPPSHPRPHEAAAAPARGHRRPGGFRQDDAAGDALQGDARHAGTWSRSPTTSTPRKTSAC